MKFFDLEPNQNEKRRILESIETVVSSQSFIMGDQVSCLEKSLEKFTGAENCVSCASGTDAIIIALLVSGINPGDKVITTPFSFVATAEAISLVGAIPVFVDIDQDTFCIDALNLEDILISKASRINAKAIIGVDIFGLPADWPLLNKMAHARGILTIADAAQSFSASIGSNKVGTLADITCTSFFPTKPLGCWGDGGALFTNNKAFADKARILRVHGSSGIKNHHGSIGMNSRLDTIQAAVLLEKLKNVNQNMACRSYIFSEYNKTLSSYGFSSQKIQPGFRSANAIFSFLFPNRQTLLQSLEMKKIPSAIYYPIPIHRQEAYQKYIPFMPEPRLPVVEFVCNHILSIPAHSNMSHQEFSIILNELNTILRGYIV